MQIANALVSLGGDHGNQVFKGGVTAAEIAVLRAIHGEDSVQEIQPCGEIKRSNREERGRLIAIYGNAKNEEQRSIVGDMFPGVAARVYDTIAELELPEEYFKATGRLSADDEAGNTVSSAEPEDGETQAAAPTEDPAAEDTVGDDIDDPFAEQDKPQGDNVLS